MSDTKPDPSAEPAKFSTALGLTSLLALFSFVTLLAFNHLADGDLWAKLSLGASVWDHGDVVRRDFFAFTPVLPVYVDHEWGAGLIFFSCLKWFGPTSLMILKIVLALATLGISMFFARREKVPWPVLWLLVIPAFFCILTGYVLVIRSYSFTYFFFAVTLLCLEEVNRGRCWPIGLLVLVTWIWANVHGGFVVGLGMIGIYALLAVWRRGPWLLLGMTTLICLAVTFLNPYGAAFWRYLIPALLHSRPFITEWRPLALWPMDNYIGFRIIFFVAVIAVPLGWKHLEKNWTGLAVMAVTALAAWHSLDVPGAVCPGGLATLLRKAGQPSRQRQVADLVRIFDPWRHGHIHRHPVFTGGILSSAGSGLVFPGPGGGRAQAGQCLRQPRGAV